MASTLTGEGAVARERAYGRPARHGAALALALAAGDEADAQAKTSKAARLAAKMQAEAAEPLPGVTLAYDTGGRPRGEAYADVMPRNPYRSGCGARIAPAPPPGPADLTPEALEAALGAAERRRPAAAEVSGRLTSGLPRAKGTALYRVDGRGAFTAEQVRAIFFGPQGPSRLSVRALNLMHPGRIVLLSRAIREARKAARERVCGGEA